MREYLLIFLIATSVTFVTAGLFRQTAVRVGMVAKVRSRDMHTQPIPYLGGVAMFAGLAMVLLLAVQMPFLGRHPIVAHDALAVMQAALVIVVVGVLDDIYDLPALVKLGGQVLAAGIAVLQGVRIYWIPLPNSIIALDDATSILVTVLFIALCTNAVNFVDGLDGLASGVVAIGALTFFLYAYSLAYEQELVRATTASLLTIATAGVCMGFLLHNWHPAKMFMGDSGSMLLGLLMAMSTISFTGQIDPAALTGSSADVLPALLPILLPFAALLLPLVDLFAAYIRRTMNGQYWFVADKAHIHHRLVDRGHSIRGAVLLMYSWTAVVSGGLVWIGLTDSPVVPWIVLAGLVAVLLWTVRPVRGPKVEESDDEIGV